MEPDSRVFVTTPPSRAAWTDILDDSDALAFQTPFWLDCISEVTGYRDASRLYVTEEGRTILLPLVAGRTPSSGVVEEMSLPFGWGFGGLVAPGGINDKDVEAVVGDLVSRAERRISVRPNPLAVSIWERAAGDRVERVSRLAHILALEGGAGVVWKSRFRGEARTAVRKAERSAVIVETDTTGRLVPAFYELYCRSAERWARQSGELRLRARLRRRRQEPLRKYTVVADRLGERCRIWLASIGGRPAAAIVVLTQGQNASYWRGAMDERLAGPARANYLLHWRAIEHAASSGCGYYHMGETGLDSSGISQFKTRFGAEPHAYFEYRFGPPPAHTSSVRQLARFARNPLRL
jgi:CelD/BcsL family acetyltransferase involved in cellulose biosynthesis